MGRAVAGRLNADRSDEKGPRRPCACGGQARYAGRRRKTFTTAPGEIELERVTHCAQTLSDCVEAWVSDQRRAGGVR